MTDPNLETPKSVRKRLESFGGRNLAGKPLWRIVLAERRTALRGGTFYEFQQGSEQFSFAEDNRYRYNPLRPTSAKTCIQEVPMYPCEGWILERLMPRWMFGTQEDWERKKGEDGITPLMGPYPKDGDYWMIDGPWEKLPAMAAVEQTIRAYELSFAAVQNEEEAKRTLALRLRQQMYATERLNQAKAEAYERDVNHMFRNRTLPRLRRMGLMDAHDRMVKMLARRNELLGASR